MKKTIKNNDKNQSNSASMPKQKEELKKNVNTLKIFGTTVRVATGVWQTLWICVGFIGAGAFVAVMIALWKWIKGFFGA